MEKSRGWRDSVGFEERQWWIVRLTSNLSSGNDSNRPEGEPTRLANEGGYWCCMARWESHFVDARGVRHYWSDDLGKGSTQTPREWLATVNSPNTLIVTVNHSVSFVLIDRGHRSRVVLRHGSLSREPCFCSRVREREREHSLV